MRMNSEERKRKKRRGGGEPRGEKGEVGGRERVLRGV